jgi:hypothetical protein
MLIRQRICNLLCDVRNIHYTLDSKKFDEVYSQLDAQTKLNIDALIEKCVAVDVPVRVQALAEFNLWLKGKNDSIRDLKNKAAQRGIHGYSRMNKMALEKALSKDKEANDSRRTTETT